MNKPSKSNRRSQHDGCRARLCIRHAGLVQPVVGQRVVLAQQQRYVPAVPGSSHCHCVDHRLACLMQACMVQPFDKQCVSS